MGKGKEESRGDWGCDQKENAEVVWTCRVKVQCGLGEGVHSQWERDSSHQQAMEDLAEPCVCRLDSDE